jgi:hypothetical protein
MQFVALLRALGMVVDSHGVSHAQLERMLCDRIIAGRSGVAALRAQPHGPDEQHLRALVAAKAAVEESGLARADGRRDKAGGQRIGELLAGKFPRHAMPSRRRVEVCVDVFLEVLAEKDPLGYAEGRYGSRELWFELWLEADQGNMPRLGHRAKTVMGYVDTALRQLTAADGRRSPAGPAGEHAHDGAEQPADDSGDAGDAGPDERLAALRTQTAAQLRAQREAHARELARALAERDEALLRAEAGRQQPDADPARDPRHRRTARVRLVVITAALTVIAAGLAGAATTALRAGPALGVVVLQSPAPYQLPPGPPGVTVPFDLASTGRQHNGVLTLRLRLASTDQADACVHDAQLSYVLRDNGAVISSRSFAPGQPQITAGPLRLGDTGDGYHLALTVVATVGKVDAGCQFTLDPSGTTVSAPGLAG